MITREMALAVPSDVAHFDEVDAAACQVEEAFGPIDVWGNGDRGRR